MPERWPFVQFTSNQAARAAAACGVAIVVLSSVPAVVVSAATPATLLPLLLFAGWAVVPYGILILAARGSRWPWAVLGAGAVAVAAEVGIRLAVFVYPRGSTAAIALVFSPLVLLVACMPAGALAGYVVGRAMASTPRWLRAVALGLAGIGLGLVTLGFARPDLFPTTVLARRRATERIGPPGVRTGSGRFEKVLVHPGAGWRLTGEFDGAPGDEIAVVERDTLYLLDPQTFTTRSQLTLAGETARWNWFSHLARRDGRLVRVDMGGGFQETRVLSLDGSRLWDYQPDPQLPPSALRPGDLDGDGEAEFYATSQDRLVRLDSNGREVWRRPMANGVITTVQAPTGSTPGWVVTLTYGDAVTVWDKDGHQLGRVPYAAESYRSAFGALDWPRERVLAFGGETLTLRGLDGSSRFDWRMPDMSITTAAAVRLAPDEPPALAIVAAADRDTHRYRLQVVGMDRTIHYDEVLDVLPQLTTATAADGTTTVLLGGDQLHALRRRPGA